MACFVVIGGSASQVPFVEAALGLGLDVVVFDRDRGSPCASLASGFFNLSTHDLAGIEKACDSLKEKAGLAGIMTYSSDKEPLLIVARLAEKYGLLSFSVEAVESCLDKAAVMRLWKGSVPVPGSCAFNDVELALKMTDLDSLNSHIVKPSAGTQGSLGVSLVNSGAELKGAFAAAKKLSADGAVIVEDYCEGRQFSVDGIVVKGEPRVFAVSEKFTSGKDGGFVIKGFAAGRAAEDDPGFTGNISSIEGVSIKAARALKIDNSFFSVDLILTTHGPVVIECGVLLDAKIDRLLSFAGIDIYGLFCGVVTGRGAAGFERLTGGGAALVFFFAERTGRLDRGDDVRSGEDYLVEWERRDGDSVRPPESIADTLGWVIAKGEDRKEAYAKALEASEGLSFRVL